MRSSLAAGLLYTGTILFSFGLATTLIALLGERYGVGDDARTLFGLALLVAGGVMGGAGFLMRRQREPQR